MEATDAYWFGFTRGAIFVVCLAMVLYVISSYIEAIHTYYNIRRTPFYIPVVDPAETAPPPDAPHYVEE